MTRTILLLAVGTVAAAAALTSSRADAACSCAGRACGNDGCGASCGTCPEGTGCGPAGECVAGGPCCTPGPRTPEHDACDCADCVCMVAPECCGAATTWGNACVVACIDCGGACPCEFDCTGRECGDDGCGGSCGVCPQGEICEGGRCRGDYPERCLGEVEPSAPSCWSELEPGGCCDAAGRVVACGPEGHLYCVDCGEGAVCGVKDGHVTCVEGDDVGPATCVGGPCVPACHDRECGDDGCGGQCGTCLEGAVCRDGKCRCMADCKDRECGPAAKCGGTCGYCKPGKVCSQEGHCVAEEGGHDVPGADPARDAPVAPDSEGKAPDAGTGGGCVAGPWPQGAWTWMLLLLLSGAIGGRRCARS